MQTSAICICIFYTVHLHLQKEIDLESSFSVYSAKSKNLTNQMLSNCMIAEVSLSRAGAAALINVHDTVSL